MRTAIFVLRPEGLGQPSLQLWPHLRWGLFVRRVEGAGALLMAGRDFGAAASDLCSTLSSGCLTCKSEEGLSILLLS